jgi:hypothetical protein
MVTLRYGKVYEWRGHRVVLVDGAKVRRISGYGNMDVRMIGVRPVPPVKTTLDRWDVPVDQLEEVVEVEADDVTYDDRPWGEQQSQVDWLERDIGP